jgi:cytoskeleton protein RodZ
MSDVRVDGEMPIRFADTAQAALDAAKSAGQMMREAREAQGLHVAALAVSLKVPVKKLEALEADRLEELPDAVFVRALASSVCRALKIDTAPVLAKLPQLNTRVLEHSEASVNVAFRTRADGPAPSMLAGLNRPVLFGVVALLLAALVLLLFPDFLARSPDTASAPNGANSTGITPATNGVSMGNPLTVPSVPEASASISSSAPQRDTATLTTLSVTPALSTPTVPSPTAVVTPAATVSSEAIPSDAIVVFAATGETWIEVRDGAGKVMLQRTLQAGESAGVGPPKREPLAVTVGRANLTQVTVRGKVFDLAPVSSKDAVARFQVK